MGSRISVESEVGRGTAFRIAIPGVKPAEESATGEVGDMEAGRKSIPAHVLVVDDSLVNRLVLSAFLKKAGVSSIDHAGDGAEALAKLDGGVKEGRPHDFVFSDFWMPNMNGLEFVEKLRSDGRFGGLPVFAVTGDTESGKDPRARLFTGMLFKPLTFNKLMEVFSL